MARKSGRRQQESRPRWERWAAIEIGVDAVRLLIGEVRRRRSGRQRFRPLGGDVERFGRGAEVLLGERIRSSDARRIRRAVRRFAREARLSEARLIVFSTESILSAPNGPRVVADVEAATGHPVRAISMARETELCFLAVRGALDREDVQLVIDAAPDSTTVVVTSGREARAMERLPVGPVSLAAALPGNPPRPLPFGLVATRLGVALSTLPPAEPTHALATGAGAHLLAGIDEHRPNRRELVALPLYGLDLATRDVLRRRLRALARMSGDDPRDTALLGPSALIVGSLMLHYDLSSVTVHRAGLRTGAILAAATVGVDWWRDGGAPAEAPSVGAEGPSGAETLEEEPSPGEEPVGREGVANVEEGGGEPPGWEEAITGERSEWPIAEAEPEAVPRPLEPWVIAGAAYPVDTSAPGSLAPAPSSWPPPFIPVVDPWAPAAFAIRTEFDPWATVPAALPDETPASTASAAEGETAPAAATPTEDAAEAAPAAEADSEAEASAAEAEAAEVAPAETPADVATGGPEAARPTELPPAEWRRA